MKTTISMIVAAVISSGHATDPPPANPMHETSGERSEFTLVRQEKDINIYTRWIPVEDSRSSREVKVTFSIPVPARRALEVLLDDDSFTTWMNGTRDYHRVSTVDQETWYSYIQFSIPWPLNDQDCIIRYRIRKHSESHIEVRLEGHPDVLLPIQGIKRISHMEGYWKFLEISPDKTLVEYQIFSNQPSSFPRWITDPIIQGSMLRTMAAFREQVTHTTSRP